MRTSARWLLPLLCLVAAVSSGYVVDAAGGSWLLRGLLSGAFIGLGSILAAKALREDDRR